MKNADMPAMPNSNPETYPVPCASEWAYGLTKREHFAGIAPNDPPIWFLSGFEADLSHIAKIELTEEEARLKREYESDNYGIPEDEFKRGQDISSRVRRQEFFLQREQEKQAYFAWRLYFADCLLAELERTDG